MRIFNKTKKITALLLSILVISTAFVFNGASTTAKASTNPVEFYSSSEYSYYIGTYKTIYIKVNTLGSNQHVYIHQTTPDVNGWYDVEASYFTTLSDGSQIWKIEDDYVGYSIQYAIKYVVDGQTYWDNNNGNNYTNANVLGSAPLAVIPASPVSSKDPANYAISANVKNLAYTKVVKVRYTQDNWATYTEKSLNYTGANSDGSEQWSTTLSLNPNTTSNFHYAVSYTVNGQTYWDNNFGSNYNY